MSLNTQARMSRLAAAAVASLGFLVPSFAAAQSACPSRGWVTLPSGDDLADVYPRQALFETLEGRVTLMCSAGADGAISRCSVEKEEPAGHGFGSAAMLLSKKLKAGPCPAAAEEAVRIPLRFVPPPEPPSREPIFDPRARTYEGGRLWPAGPYWPEGALEHGVAGFAILDCKLQPDGRLWPCPSVRESPSGAAFAEASLKMAERGWMKAAPLAAGEVAAPESIYRIKVVFARKTLRDVSH